MYLVVVIFGCKNGRPKGVSYLGDIFGILYCCGVALLLDLKKNTPIHLMGGHRIDNVSKYFYFIVFSKHL
jgi:hypothetical protein